MSDATSSDAALRSLYSMRCLIGTNLPQSKFMQGTLNQWQICHCWCSPVKLTGKVTTLTFHHCNFKGTKTGQKLTWIFLSNSECNHRIYFKRLYSNKESFMNSTGKQQIYFYWAFSGLTQFIKINGGKLSTFPCYLKRKQQQQNTPNLIQFLNLYRPVLTETEAVCQRLMIQFYMISFFSQIQIFRGTNNLLCC